MSDVKVFGVLWLFITHGLYESNFILVLLVPFLVWARWDRSPVGR